MDGQGGADPRGRGREASLAIDGSTRLIGILGDPIAQVKAPAVLNPLLAARGLNAVLVPLRVPVANFDGVMAGLGAILNLDALVITVPHKVAVLRHVEWPSARARQVGAANVVRREPDGAWAADITDGLGFVGAARAAGFEPAGRTALVVGSGGVGAAITHALIEVGAARVVVTDTVAGKAEALAARLGATAGTADPRGYDLVVNATPMGMRPEDPLPFDPTALSARQFVGEVITLPEMSPLLRAARARGCRFSTGPGMVEAQATHIADFITAYIGGTPPREGSEIRAVTTCSRPSTSRSPWP
jgi:shikimate dehydrogenase